MATKKKKPKSGGSYRRKYDGSFVVRRRGNKAKISKK
jgi:hypothetical protein